MKKIIYTENAPEPLGPYNQAVLVNDTLYASGQIALNPATNKLVLNTIESETTMVMNNIKAVLEAAQMDFKNVVKCSIFLTDMNNFSKVNSIYETFFSKENAPARETVAVKTLPKNVNIEISVIAVK